MISRLKRTTLLLTVPLLLAVALSQADAGLSLCRFRHHVPRYFIIISHHGVVFRGFERPGACFVR
jgi:hypothetical protein